MGLSQALSTGVSGLVTHQKALDNIGNNLANINTVGYKKGVYQFSTLLEQSLRSGSAASGSTGSVNPIALGMGAQTGSINKVFTQGTLETTGSANDMAISGNGFFVVNTGSGYAYTRDGSFYVSEDGHLMGGNGYYVQGTMAIRNSDGSYSVPQDAKLENLIIPIGSTGGMSKTSNVAFAGNLNSTQSVASGLKLYGTHSPTVNDLQSWMSTNNNSKDDSWSALEKATYSISEELYQSLGNPALPSDVSVVSGGVQADYVGYAVATVNGVTGVVSVADLAAGDPSLTLDANGMVSVAELTAGGYIPVVQEINTINGGNVQTSQAFGISVPAYDKTVANGITYPEWFYQSTGSSLSYSQIIAQNDIIADAGSTAAEVDAAIRAIWPDGVNGEGWRTGTLDADDLPVTGSMYAASLSTPLENLYVYENNKWSQMFSNLKEGDEITVSFDKGNSTYNATFIYNKPGAEAVGNQQAIDYEKSYTLEHFLTFLAGDVDNTGTACSAISPEMFGEWDNSVPPEFIYDENAYNEALANLALAQADSNTSTSGGAMGLIDVAAYISAANGGTDDYDAPMETAGAFTREGVSQVNYTRVNADGTTTTYKSDSFNISLVSNLGGENALSNISISHNNTTSKTVFSNEADYAAESGGSATASVTYYDSLGNAHTCTVRMALVSEDSTGSTWRWYADCTDDTDFAWQADPATGELISNLNVGTGVFRFDTDGNFIAGSDHSETGGIVINLENQGVDDTIKVSIINGLNSKEKQDLDFSALTFTATKNSLSLSEQNGAPPGSLDSYTVANDGTIYGVYSTGKTIALGQIVLATVPNMNGMLAGSNNLYYTTPASGDAQYGYPDTGGRGEILQYQLETSNVDMSEEFTKMIAIERGYQANSRIITTADEMLQELLSMVR